MPSRNRALRGSGKVHGYSYRDSVDTDIDGEFETPDQTFRPERSAPTQSVITRKDEFPVLEALVNVAGDELGELKKDANNRQAVEGAIDAGMGKGMDEIAKRKSFSDAVFGTRARKESAAKIKASIGVNDYYSNQISNMTHNISTDPEQYITDQREILSKQHGQIEAAHGRDVADAFIAQGVQRLEQLVQMQVSEHHKWVQQEASSDFQKDILARAGIITQLYSEPGMEMQADADLQNLFDENNRPADMTPEAWHNNIAQAIITDMKGGNRRLYEYADQMGVLDNMPASVQADLEETYRQTASIHNFEFLDASENLLDAMTNPAVSEEAFRQQQKAFMNDWRDVHKYSAKELANQRTRKAKSLEAAQKKNKEKVDNSSAWMHSDLPALSRLSPKEREDAASTGITNLVAKSLDQRGESDLLSELTNTKDEGRQAEIVYTELLNNPELLTTVTNRAAQSGYVVKELASVLNDGATALMVGDQVNPKAVETLELQRVMHSQQPEYVTKLNKNDAQLSMYTRLRESGHSPELAVQLISAANEKPVDAKTTSWELREKAEKKGMRVLRQHFGSTDLKSHESEMRANLQELSDIYMSAGFPADDAYTAAAERIKTQYEIVGGTVVNRNSDMPLATQAGIQQDPENNITTAMNTAMENVAPDYTGNLGEYHIEVDEEIAAVRLRYTGDDPEVSEQVHTVTFADLRAANADLPMSEVEERQVEADKTRERRNPQFDRMSTAAFSTEPQEQVASTDIDTPEDEG